MSTWNKYAEEVLEKRRFLRAYGLDSLDQLPATRVWNYKAQALRELALRLELETALQDVRAQLAKAVDRFEAAETALDSARLPLERAPG